MDYASLGVKSLKMKYMAAVRRLKCGTSASIWTYIILNKFKRNFQEINATCVSDEETFGLGSRWLMDNELQVLGDCCLNGEPSSPYTIRYRKKGLLWLTFKFKQRLSWSLYSLIEVRYFSSNRSNTGIKVSGIIDAEVPPAC